MLLVDKRGAFGRGVAYATNSAHHLLNVPAGKISAFGEEPDHFLDWLQAHSSELAKAGITDLTPAPSCLAMSTGNTSVISLSEPVLCTGIQHRGERNRRYPWLVIIFVVRQERQNVYRFQSGVGLGKFHSGGSTDPGPGIPSKCPLPQLSVVSGDAARKSAGMRTY